MLSVRNQHHGRLVRLGGVFGDTGGTEEMSTEIENKWYEFYYSIIFTPPGEVPQVRGKWMDDNAVVEMLAHLKSEHPNIGKMIVATSRCGEIYAEDADEWIEMRKVGIECAEIEAAYIKAGICSQCGACSKKEAETKCSPSALGDTGEYTCDGERLWESEEE